VATKTLELGSELKRISAGAFRLANQYLTRHKADLKVLHYCFRNWGDAINPALVEFVSGRSVQSVDIDARSLLPLPRDPQADTLHLVVGSILHHADCQTVVWGAGFQSAGITPKQPPKAVHAVRGPLTAGELRKQGIDCPEVFGDPVLLLPRYYRPEGRKRYRLGIIPHFSDQADGKMAKYHDTDEVKIIDIRGGLWSTVNILCECEHIVSTSLHGLILADAYGIPNAWAKLGDHIPGGTFKFNDYYRSIGVGDTLPTVSLTETVDELCRLSLKREVALDLDRLLRACPFRWSDAPNRHRQTVESRSAVEAQLP
jgi:pyruvyltransferase